MCVGKGTIHGHSVANAKRKAELEAFCSAAWQDAAELLDEAVAAYLDAGNRLRGGVEGIRRGNEDVYRRTNKTSRRFLAELQENMLSALKRRQTLKRRR